jgi:hypothetical protein
MNIASCKSVTVSAVLNYNWNITPSSLNLIMLFESFNDVIFCNGFILKIKAPSPQQHRSVDNILNNHKTTQTAH